ncbi:22720_t:CDS:2 [Cetraspora pellucida]|uniref:22720_t:CDS:1 n=1 Tax=Cetraspora pellucida TaxID=1433469 RepID=A0A9N9FBX4_9GLOM|nr:22720_t:CDS:2 [Cetraspora pellucida]
MLESPKYNEKTKEHVCEKKAIHPKNRTVFDFMIHPSNDESEVVESPLLDIAEPEVKRCNGTNSETTQAEFDFVESLFKKNCIEGISDPNDYFVWGDLIDMYVSEQKFSRNEIYNAIQATIAYLAKYEVNLVELDGEVVKLINLIDQAVTKSLILYRNINFLSYSLNTLALNTKFFNLFLGFLAKPAMGINKEIIDPILWHVLNIICNKNEELNEYIWNWWAYLVQRPENKPQTILVLKSTLQQCRKNIITNFIGDKVLGSYLYFATSDLEKILGCFNSAIQA